MTPFVPHLNLLWHFGFPRPLAYWLQYDLDVLIHCDALVRIAGESQGADAEVAFAEKNGIPVFESIWDLSSWAKLDWMPKA